MKHDSLCPICGEGNLIEKTVQNERSINGVKKIIPLQSSDCDFCGTELATPSQSRANKRVMIAFDKEANGLLTGAQVKKIRENLGLTRADAARIFGGGPVAFNKYENNDICQSVSMDKLLRLASNIPEAFDYLQSGCPDVIESVMFFNNSTPYHHIPTVQKRVDIEVISYSSVLIQGSQDHQVNRFYSSDASAQETNYK